MALSRAQRGVRVGALLALAVTFVAPPLAAALAPDLARADAGARLVLAAQAALGPALALTAAIGALANHRFRTPADIDGGGLTAGTPRAKLLQAILQNTLEQAALAALAYAAFAATAPAPWLGAVPAAALLFVLGRALFAAGYARGAAARALGFGLTFYPTAGLLMAAALLLALG